MKRASQRIFPVLLAFVLLLVMIPIGTVSVSAEAITPDTSWYTGHETDTSYTISTAAQLLGFSQLIAKNVNFVGKTVQLASDVDLNPGWTASATAPANEWAGSYTNTYGFNGTFEGNGHTVSGIYMKSGDRAGIFGKQTGNSDNITITVRNLAIVNSYVEGANQYVGGLFGIAKGGTTGKTVILSNLYLDIDVVNKYAPESSPVSYTGGMIGMIGSGTTTIQSCVFVGSVTNTGANATCIGGIAGVMANQTIQNVTIQDTAFYGRLKIAGSDFGFGIGFVDGNTTATTRKLTVRNLILAGTRSGGSNAANFSRAIYTKFLETEGCVTFDNLLHTSVFGGVYYKRDGSTYTKMANGSVTGTAVITADDLNGLSAVKTLSDHEMTGWVTDPNGGSPLPESVYKMLYHSDSSEGDDSVTSLAGYQLTPVTDNKYSIRLVGTLNLPDQTSLADIEKIGFLYKLAKADGTQTDELSAECKWVYESLRGLDGTDVVTYSAASLGGDYLFAFALQGLPVSLGDLSFTVVPFYQLNGGEKVTGTAECFTLTVANFQ